MLKRRLGKSALEVAPLAFGGNVFGWTADERTSFELLDEFVNAGFNLVDTSDAYSRHGPGFPGADSEIIIGNWISARRARDKIIVATKVGFAPPPNGGCLSKTHIVEAVEASLIRLRTDYIDLYQSHIDDARTPLDETLEAYAALIAAGKVRFIGASNYSPERLSQALTVSNSRSLPRYEVIQVLYNLYAREAFEAELKEICRDAGLGVLSYFSLASGFLSGKYRSKADLLNRKRASRVEPMMNERGFRILAAIDEICLETGATSAQVSLAWILTRRIEAAIVSATDLIQLRELLSAVEIALSEGSLKLLDEASQSASAKTELADIASD